MEKGLKKDFGKTDWTILPFDALEEIVKVLEFGEKKYARNNWQNIKPRTRYLKAAFRHLIAYASGEKFDSESGLSHLAHCGCCILFMLWYEKRPED